MSKLPSQLHCDACSETFLSNTAIVIHSSNKVSILQQHISIEDVLRDHSLITKTNETTDFVLGHSVSTMKYLD